jgi:hypothetical protein
MNENPYEQSLEQLFRRLKKAIVVFETLGEKRWRTDMARIYGKKLLEIVMAFTTLQHEDEK